MTFTLVHILPSLCIELCPVPLHVRYKGVLLPPLGDRLFITLNMTLMNNAHRNQPRAGHPPNNPHPAFEAAHQWKK